jgi:hypothetical protein
MIFLGVALAVGGCADERTQIKAKVQQLATASAHKDYTQLCRDVLAPSLVERLQTYSISCERAMQIALSNVRNPTLSVGRITVHGRLATAITLSVAHGQQASLEAVELIHTSHGWRISALGSPLTTAEANEQ